MRRLSLLCLFLLACLAGPEHVAAQRRPGGGGGGFGNNRGFGGGGGNDNDPSVLRGIPDVRSGFYVCRLWYQAVRSDPSGTGWRIEYPRADINFMIRVQQLTTTTISYWSNGSEGYTVVRANDRELQSCPWVVMASAGTAGFSDAEVQGLREFLLRGGFLWGDDFWGDASWNHWVGEIKRVLPEYDIVELTPEHPLFQVLYVIPEVPQIPSLNQWRQGQCTCERPGDPQYARPSMHGIFDKDGHLMVLMTHNTDIADGWEREADMASYFEYFTARAYAVGMNVAVWVMTR